jgi:hypothetical protein
MTHHTYLSIRFEYRLCECSQNPPGAPGRRGAAAETVIEKAAQNQWKVRATQELEESYMRGRREGGQGPAGYRVAFITPVGGLRVALLPGSCRRPRRTSPGGIPS